MQDVYQQTKCPFVIIIDEWDCIFREYRENHEAQEQYLDFLRDFLKDKAQFSVFRRSSEAPLYRIEKRPALARRQGAWAVIGQGGMVLRRGHELEQVLRFFDKGRFKVVD